MRIALILLSLMLAVPAVANASSVAYVENGEVWVSSLDGAKKVRIAGPVVNSSGATEKWLAVAASDGGRIVAVRNEPGKTSKLSWFKVWEPDGTSTVEAPLTAPNGWLVYVFPLSLDVTADGAHMVYGFSNSSGCCPINFSRGTYVRPVSTSVLDPIVISGYEEPTLLGSRVIAKTSSVINVQSSGTPYGSDFEPWVDVSGTGLDLRRTDVAATGTLAAYELEQWSNGGQVVGKIGVASIAGVDTPYTPGAVDCYLPASGVAKDVSLSQDGRSIAWTDGQGLKVAREPTTSNELCTLASAPVVIAAGGTSASIGGADVSAFLPPAPTPPVTTPPTPPTPGTGPVTPAPPKAPALPAKVTAKSLTSGLKITVGAAGKVTVTATVGAKKVGSGSATAKAAGQVTVKLKLTKAGRKLARKGKKVKLKVTQAGRTTTRTVKLS
jgi:hypothetical protein